MALLLAVASCAAEPGAGGTSSAEHGPLPGDPASSSASGTGEHQTDPALLTSCGNGACDGEFEDCLTCPLDCEECTAVNACEVAPNVCTTTGEITEAGLELVCNLAPPLCDLIGGNPIHGEGPNCNASANACGNGVCQRHACERADNCPADCPAVCGDGLCTHDETHASCPGDCPAVCGDGACNGAETCATCSGDCGRCRTCDSGGLRCGDGICNCRESFLNCSHDCAPGPCNNDGTCEPLLGEAHGSCGDCA